MHATYCYFNPACMPIDASGFAQNHVAVVGVLVYLHHDYNYTLLYTVAMASIY